MAVASGIIAVSYLEIPLHGKILGLASLGDVSVTRAWIATLCLLCYLTLRFHYAPGVSTQRHEAAESYRKWRQVNIEQTVRTSVADEASWGPLNIKFTSRPAERFKARAVNARNGRLQDWAGEIVIAWQQDARPTGVYSGVIANSEASYRFSMKSRAKVMLCTMRSARLFKWPALEIAVPYILTTIAACICFIKLALSVLPQ